MASPHRNQLEKAMVLVPPWLPMKTARARDLHHHLGSYQPTLDLVGSTCCPAQRRSTRPSRRAS